MIFHFVASFTGFGSWVFPFLQNKAKKVVQAQKLWFAMLEAQIETGNPYILFKVIFHFFPSFSFLL
jgi:transcription initiation factor IIF auxiliary subunit